ncbi:MAG: sigma-70 family RNA polymerase sigma factor [Chloroflexi bacterium]|nr:MAG: sigma-70 family RNA polymerase sigma factor [Chloroflexota bacterium]
MKLAELPDSDLVWLARGGSEPAFNELLARHDGRVFDTALTSLRDCRSDAEDAMQDARLACWAGICAGGQIDDFGAWYLGIARKCCHDFYKNRQRTADWATYDDVEEMVASPLEQIIDLEERSYLHGAVDVLPARQAQAVRMHYLESRDYSEIAREMGITESAVRDATMKGLANLRERLGDKAEALGL